MKRAPAKPDETVKAFFETDAYLAANPIVPLRARLVQALVGDITGCRVLDLGCGDGSLSRPFLASGNHVTMVDFSRPMLDRARAAAPADADAEFIEGDLLACDLDEGYDVVLCVGVLAHVPSVPAVIRRATSAVRSSGICVFQITDNGRPLGWLLNKYALRDARQRRFNFTSMQQLQMLLSQNGLVTKASARYGLLIPGTGRFPIQLQERLEDWAARSPLVSSLSSELLVSAEKIERAAPRTVA